MVDREAAPGTDHDSGTAPGAGARPAPETTLPDGTPKVARFAKAGALSSLLAALVLALHEVSNVAAGFVTSEGARSSPGMLGSPWAWRERQHWNGSLGGEVGGVPAEQVWGRIVLLFQAVDVLFIAVYAYAALALLGTLRPSGGVRTSGWRRLGLRRPATVGVRLVLLLAAVDLAECVVHAALALRRSDATGISETWTTFAAVLSLAKWLLALLVLLLVLWFAATRAAWQRVRQLSTALYAQRFSLLAFLPLAVLGVLPLGTAIYDVFDQLPDVQRAWLDSWSDAVDIVWAGLVVVLALWVPIFLLGRVRADWAVRRQRGGNWWPHYTREDGAPRRLGAGFWFGGPAVVVVAAAVAAATGGEVYGARLLAFVSVPLVVGGLSLWLARRNPSRRCPTTPKPRGPGYGNDVMAVGDVLAVSAVAMTGLGCVRAFTGPTVLAGFGLLDVSVATQVGQLTLAAAGATLAVLAWPVAQALLDGLRTWALERLTSAPRADVGSVTPRSSGFLAAVPPPRVAVPGLPRDRDGDARRDLSLEVLMASSTLALVLLCAFPRQISGPVGALAAMTLALGTLTVMLGAFVAYAQERQPPELLQVLGFRFRATPVLLLLSAVVVATSVIGGRTDVHPVASPAGEIPDRPSMTEAFTLWRDVGAPCSVPYADEPAFTLRPMLMYAAEGGGIRAAYWTASALDRVASAAGDRSTCGRHAALFSAGASGGAVGLTIGRLSDEPREVAQAMAEPDALGAGATGLLAGDVLASVAGVRFSAPAEHRDDDRAPLDRAGLMEVAWEDSEGVEALRDSFIPAALDDATSGDGAVTGHLVLTSSVLWDGCRALVSQLDLSRHAQAEGGWPECGVGDAGAHGFDLLHHYGRHEADAGQAQAADQERCLGNPRALTAGLLASRFPYVTPSGVVGPCREMDAMQLIDGGYTDNTGLGTVVSLGDLWGGLVREHNDQQLLAGSGELIVPMVVYLENGTGEDYTVVDPQAAGVEAGDVAQAARAAAGEPLARSSDDDAQVRPEGARKVQWPRSLGVPEALVPPIGALTGSGATKVKALGALEAASDLTHESLCSPGRSDACAALRRSVQTRGVYLVRQSPQPSMPAPLGWVLSEASRAEMAADLCVQETTRSADLPRDSAREMGYGTLRDLLDALGLSPEDGCGVTTSPASAADRRAPAG